MNADYVCEECRHDQHGNCTGWLIVTDEEGVDRWRSCLCTPCAAAADDPPYDLGRADGDVVGDDPMTRWRNRDAQSVIEDDRAAYEQSMAWGKARREASFCPSCGLHLDHHDGPDSCDTAREKAGAHGAYVKGARS